jgi:ADP-ribose pyrophosphatase
VLARRRVFEGFFKMDAYTIEMDRHDGGRQVVERLIFERGDAVAVLAYDPMRDAVLLVKEMRPGLLAAGEYPYGNSLPAGMIDAGEDILAAAAREMREETGLDLHAPVVIHAGAYVSSGGTSERVALVFGLVDMTEAGGIHGCAEEGEDIKSVVVSADDFIAQAESGALKDMKCLACAFWLARRRDALQQSARTGESANDNPSGTGKGGDRRDAQG